MPFLVTVAPFTALGQDWVRWLSCICVGILLLPLLALVVGRTNQRKRVPVPRPMHRPMHRPCRRILFRWPARFPITLWVTACGPATQDADVGRNPDPPATSGGAPGRPTGPATGPPCLPGSPADTGSTPEPQLHPAAHDAHVPPNPDSATASGDSPGGSTGVDREPHSAPLARPRRLHGQVLDVSGGGLRVRVQETLPPGTPLHIVPEFTGPFPLAGLPCRVVSSHQEGGQTYLQLCFVRLSADTEARIVRRIYQHQLGIGLTNPMNRDRLHLRRRRGLYRARRTQDP